jgi:hypothetical protein
MSIMETLKKVEEFKQGTLDAIIYYKILMKMKQEL